MHTFKDVNGKDWTIQLDTNMTRELRSEIGVDLLNLDKQTVSDLTTNDEMLVDVISFICTEQIKHKEMDAKSFAACMVGEALDNACDALVNEVVFISRRSQREVAAKAWEKTKAAEEMMTAETIEFLDSGVVEKQAQKAVDEMKAQLGDL